MLVYQFLKFQVNRKHGVLNPSDLPWNTPYIHIYLLNYDKLQKKRCYEEDCIQDLDYGRPMQEYITETTPLLYYSPLPERLPLQKVEMGVHNVSTSIYNNLCIRNKKHILK